MTSMRRPGPKTTAGGGTGAVVLNDRRTIALGEEILGRSPIDRERRRVALSAAGRIALSVALVSEYPRKGRCLERGVREIIGAGWGEETPTFLVGGRGEGIPGTLGSRARPGFARGCRFLFVGWQAEVVERGWTRSPLAGRRFIVTRAQGEGTALASRLGALGADAIVWPAIEVVPPDDARPLRLALRRLARFDWIVFASRHAVEGFFSAARRIRAGGRRSLRARFAAVGPATAESLRSEGLRAHLVPRRPSAAGLLAAFARIGPRLNGARVLLARSEISETDLAAGLERLGAEVTAVATHSVRTPRPDDSAASLRRLASRGAIDAFFLASGSAARGVRERLGERRSPRPLPAIAIGRETARVANELRFRVRGVATAPNDAALVALSLRLFRKGPKTPSASPRPKPLL
jgi:uroporphyrinogen-III synthase